MKETNVSEIKTAVLLGSGNVARSLGIQMINQGISVLQVYSRTSTHAQKLALELKSDYTAELTSINRHADVYIFAVSDDAISEVLKAGFCRNGQHVLIHTAGSVPLNIFDNYADHYGILYPLQTFSAERTVDLKTVPLLIEASDQSTLKTITGFAGLLSNRVMEADSSARMWIHLAAVISSNFANHLFALSHQLLEEKKIPFDILKPLLSEMVEKAFLMTPEKAQTGPAIRGNKQVIAKHLKLLQDHPEIRELYSMITSGIQRTNEVQIN